MNKKTGLLLFVLGAVATAAALMNWVNLGDGVNQSVAQIMDWRWERQAMLVGGLLVVLVSLISLRGKKKKK
jgi:hypothetical protein